MSTCAGCWFGLSSTHSRPAEATVAYDSLALLQLNWCRACMPPLGTSEALIEAWENGVRVLTF